MKKYKIAIFLAILVLGCAIFANPIQPIFSFFTDLMDAPSGYSGDAGKLLVVNPGEDAVEFTDSPTVASLTISGLSGVPYSDEIVVMDGITGTLTTWTQYSNVLLHSHVDDIPVDGVTADPVSSNWAFDHDANLDDHHTKYTDSEARTATVSDTAYGAGWNGVTTYAASKNAIYDELTDHYAGSGTLTGDGAADRVPYYTDTQVLGNEAAFAYDPDNNTLAIGNISIDGVQASNIESQDSLTIIADTSIIHSAYSFTMYYDTGVDCAATWGEDATNGEEGIYLDNSASGEIHLYPKNKVLIHCDVSLGFGDLVSEQNPNVVEALRLKGTGDDVDVVLGDASGYFTVWNAADDVDVFYVNNRGDTDIAGDLTIDGTIINTDFTTLTDNSMADALHRHTELVASDGSPDPALSVDEAGRVGIGTSDPEGSLEIRTGNSIMRIRDTDDTATATTSFIEFGGTTASNWDRTGYVGDGSVGDTNISLRAEDSDLILGDSSSPTVLTLSGGDVTVTGDLTIVDGWVNADLGGFASNRDLCLTGGFDSDFYIKNGATEWLNIYPDVSGNIIIDALVGDITIDAGGGDVSVVGTLGAGDVTFSKQTLSCSRTHFYLSSDKTISSGGYHKIDWNAEAYDNLSEGNLSTDRFTPTDAGYYQITLQIRLTYLTTANNRVLIKIDKGAGATTVLRMQQSIEVSSSEDIYMNISKVVYLSSSSDYLEAWIHHDQGTNQTLNGSATGLYTWWTIHRIS